VQVTITTHTESYCIYSKGNYNIFEQISMHDNVGTGLRHYNGGHNLFLNCDSYRNWDNVSENQLGGNTDGFGCHPNTSGAGNVFRGCRAWFNSDDGFDIIRSGSAVKFDSCWSFYNGYSTSFQSLGDGNGFKAGGFAYDDSTKIPNPVPRHTIEFCIAAKNKANGFYANHHLSGNYWYNNSAYQNSTNFNMLNRPSVGDAVNIDGPGYDHILKNNLSYQKGFGLRDTANIDTSRNTLVTNSWQLSSSLTDSDFISLDINLLTSPRKADGSLPDVDFMRPAPGSKLIDAGTDIGFAFSGKAPDIGAIETDYPTDVKSIENTKPDNIHLYQNYPNPFNPVTIIKYSIPERSNVSLTIYDILGGKVATLINQQQNAGSYEVNFNPSLIKSGLSSGIYFYTLKTDAALITKKLIYLK
ncbi:MAG: T9SS type A sorting domain-containing protein, partial [Ignavibacteriaceae bacterium]